MSILLLISHCHSFFCTEIFFQLQGVQLCLKSPYYHAGKIAVICSRTMEALLCSQLAAYLSDCAYIVLCSSRLEWHSYILITFVL